MADQMEALIRLLAAEAGYREGKGNRNKFSTDLGHPPDAWCFDFLDWGAQKVGMTADQFPMSRWVPDAMTWGKKRGTFTRGSSGVRRGALLLCGSDRPRHIELALSGVGRDGRIERVGGNTNANGSANGDGVYHDRYRRASTVYGTVMPDYGTTGPAPAATPAVLDVTQTQTSLAALGYSPGAADGVLGPSTKAATAAYQADRGLTADGVPGPTTRQHLEADMATIDQIYAELMKIRPDIATVHTSVLNTPNAVLNARINRAGGPSGPTTLAQVVAWYDSHVVRILDAVAATGEKAGLTADQLAQIRAAVAEVQAADVAEHLVVQAAPKVGE